MNKIEYKNIIAFHPGYYLTEYLDEMEISTEDFAKELKISPETLNNLLNGENDVSSEIANNLSTVLKTSSSMWLNLNEEYNKKIEEINLEKQSD